MNGSNATINTFRLESTGDKETYPGTPYLIGIDCYIERVDPNVAQMMDERNAFFTYKVFIDEIVDIKVSDKIVDQNGKVYIVHGISEFPNNLDTSDLMEITTFLRYPE